MLATAADGSTVQSDSGGGDTLGAHESTTATDTLGRRLRPSEYRYAGSPRYTLTGDMPLRSTQLQPLPMAITAGVVAGAVTGVHIYQANAWWHDPQHFHFYTDWTYAAQADKFGHMFAGYFTSYLGYEALVASGFAHSTAAWLSPALSYSWMTYVELEDGFSRFGFDPTDQLSNTVGVGLFVAQQFIKPLQNVRLKWSYYPAGYLDEGYLGHDRIIVDDYNGQTVWLALKLGDILPSSLQWPRWLQLAVGYGATNVDNWEGPNMTGRLLDPHRRLLVALDYSLVDMLPDLGTFGNWIVQTLDYIHLPAPALQILPEVKFYIAFPIVF